MITMAAWAATHLNYVHKQAKSIRRWGRGHKAAHLFTEFILSVFFLDSLFMNLSVCTTSPQHIDFDWLLVLSVSSASLWDLSAYLPL